MPDGRKRDDPPEVDAEYIEWINRICHELASEALADEIRKRELLTSRWVEK
jgi:hypothetical protein